MSEIRGSMANQSDSVDSIALLLNMHHLTLGLVSFSSNEAAREAGALR